MKLFSTVRAAPVLLKLLVLACALGTLPAAQAAAGLPSNNTAWVAAATDADVDRAFARARAEKKPLLLYWGASWCPPCNQLKATLFNRQDFAVLARSFVPVSVDGDRPGAQKLGQRFKVVGYPTTVLFSADGKEITRLPGEVDAPQALAVLQLGLASGRPIKAVLANALQGRPLAATEWRLLAFYSWDTDEGQLVSKVDRPGLLVRLAVAGSTTPAAAEPEVTTRLWLKALAASDEGQGVKPDAALRERLMRVLADPAQARLQMDLLVASAPDMVRNFESADPEFGAAPSRAPLLAAYDTALQRLQNDATLSRADRQSALTARVELARLDLPKSAVQLQLPEPLLKEVRDFVARADSDITDGYERQAVITEAAFLLGRAGLWPQSDALLVANLTKSHSPYYLMSQLAGNARKLGRTADALRWYGQAHAQSEGASTRLQWGSSYLTALVELSPQDSATIEKTAAQLLTEAARDRSAFEGRSARSLQRAGAQLIGWNTAGRHAAVLRRLQVQLDAVCAKVGAPDARRACTSVLKPKST